MSRIHRPDFAVDMKLPHVSVIDVVKHRHKTDGWIIVGEYVYDVTKYIERHPGGNEILCASLGRDASTDFNLIAGHFSERAQQMLSKMMIAMITRATSVEWVRWCGVLDYVTMLHNSFQMQFAHSIDPVTKMIFCGQSYFHFLDEHVANVVNLMEGPATTHARSVSLNDLCYQVMFLAKERIKAITSNAEPSKAITLLEHMKTAILELSDHLLEKCSSLISRLETKHAVDVQEEAAHVHQIMDCISNWVAGEYTYWNDSWSSGTDMLRHESQVALVGCG